MLSKIYNYLKGLFVDEEWWEIEAEECGMTVGQYLDMLKLQKESAELELEALKKKEDARSRRQKWDDYQAEKLEEERAKVAGYEQVAKVHSAYISILLKRLGATEDNKVDVQAAEISEALEKLEARAVATESGFSLYYAEG